MGEPTIESKFNFPRTISFWSSVDSPSYKIDKYFLRLSIFFERSKIIFSLLDLFFLSFSEISPKSAIFSINSWYSEVILRLSFSDSPKTPLTNFL